ncbi:DUF2752 domain-containing protein [Miniphocaeibacter massiliensis]|uniref:DUF2752 domain-containing protein n=1 Tax=Miniphocaeibacter massiliensis TaxID=2041841 RepID=UPI0013EA4A0C|nr:DUF2752 domain-containing protein [Miniphocaeibacter massiliensis]
MTKKFKIAIPCPINAVTGLYCPGCGVTRLIMSITKGDIYTAFRSNIALFVLSPALIYIIVKYVYGYIEGKNKFNKFDTKLTYVLIVVLIVFALLRNIPYFDYLQPIVK